MKIAVAIEFHRCGHSSSGSSRKRSNADGSMPPFLHVIQAQLLPRQVEVAGLISPPPPFSHSGGYLACVRFCRVKHFVVFWATAFGLEGVKGA